MLVKALACSLFLLISGVIVAEEDVLVPYIYYYSQALNGIVIERADGSDSRLIGQGLVKEPKSVYRVGGPGWSPDGKWFAWNIEIYTGSRWTTQAKGYVVSIDGQTSLEVLDALSCTQTMEWSEDGQWLLISGVWKTDYYTDAGCSNVEPILTYWLINMQTLEIQAHYEGYITPDRAGGNFNIRSQWDLAAQQVSFSIIGNYFPDIPSTSVTLYFDGRVTSTPLSQEEPSIILTEAVSQSRGFINVDDLESSSISPNSQYDIDFFTPALLQTDSNTSKPIKVNSSAGEPYAVAIHWHNQSQYALIGYEFCSAGCGYVPYHVSIIDVDGQLYRELSACGVSRACVNWLPVQVEIANLPAGSETSVVPMPLEYDDSEEHRHYDSSPIYELVCDPQSRQKTLILEVATNEITFQLSSGGKCIEWRILEENPVPVLFYNPDVTEPIAFALSPKKNYYAIGDNRAFVELFDASTHEHIANLNVSAVEMWFSPDERFLFTKARNAIIKWDMTTLLNQSN